MRLIDRFREIRSSLSKDVRLFNAGERAVDNSLAHVPTWFWTAKYGFPRNINAVELRQYAKSPWVQMVKSAIKKQLMTTEWDVIISDEEDNETYDEDVEKVKQLLMYPNRMGTTFWELWGAFMDDVLDLDAGVIQKARNGSGELKELFTYDGSTFLIDIDGHGIVNKYWQYSYKFPKGAPKEFERDEIIYGKIGNNTDQYPYGWSPLQSIQQEIEVMIQSTRFNKEFFKNNAVPDGIVSVPMDQDALDRFRRAWEQHVKGKAHKLIFHNSDANFTPLNQSNKDMEWLEGQKWYFHVVFAAYGLSPQEVGFYENSNRSTGESQERITIKNAIQPYLKLISDKINREIIPELVGHDKIKFEWFPVDDAKEKIEHEQQMAKLNAGVITINEIRVADGLEPVEWGDKPMPLVMQEQFAENNPNDEEEKEKDKDKDKEERDKARKLYNNLFKSFMTDKNG